MDDLGGIFPLFSETPISGMSEELAFLRDHFFQPQKKEGPKF